MDARVCPSNCPVFDKNTDSYQALSAQDRVVDRSEVDALLLIAQAIAGTVWCATILFWRATGYRDAVRYRVSP
jgi:hypothetical protein